jgi:5-methyltetrahydropteroyltriglutamate--homocysteine methyltransferase
MGHRFLPEEAIVAPMARDRTQTGPRATTRRIFASFYVVQSLDNDLMDRLPARADHIGSLLRPAPLRQAFRAYNAGEQDETYFVAAQNAAIRDVIKLQEEIGLSVVTDGEFRRGSYWSSFVEGTEGLGVADARFQFHDEEGRDLAFTAPFVTGEVARRKPIALEEFHFLFQHTRAIAKVTLPAPSTMHFWRGSGFAAPGVYSRPRDFFRDIGEVYRAEIADLAAAGCRYVQLDEVALAMLCDPAVRARVASDGSDPHQVAELYVEAIAEAVAGAPADLAIGLHLCRGNFKGKYLAEGGYDRIAKTLFGCAGVTHFLLEFDTARAGDFRPLRFVPPDKGVVLGLISTKNAVLEDVETLLGRIDEAAQWIDKDRLAISPQCGFASTVAGNPISQADQRAKLLRCVEAARTAW